MEVKKYVSENKSDIAFGLGLVLGVASTVVAGLYSHRVKAKIDEAKAALPEGEKLGFKGYVKACWKDIIPPALLTAGSVVCHCVSKHGDKKTIAATVGAYLMESEFRRTFEEKVREQLGEEKVDEMRKDILAKKDPIADARLDAYPLQDGDEYFKDPYTNKLFVASPTKIKKIVNDFNNRLNTDDYECLNFIYEEIYEETPIPLNKKLRCDLGEFMGFNVCKGLIDIEIFTSEESKWTFEDGRVKPVFLIRFIDKKTGIERMPSMFYEVGE